MLGHGADVKCIDWHPSKALVVSGSKDNQQPVKLWDPKAGQGISTLYECYTLVVFNYCVLRVVVKNKDSLCYIDVTTNSEFLSHLVLLVNKGFSWGRLPLDLSPELGLNLTQYNLNQKFN